MGKKAKVEIKTIDSLANLNLSENSPQNSSLRVDRTNNVIYGVKILGDTSKNCHPVSGLPYKYSEGALKGFAPLQEGSRVFLNHQDPSLASPRKYEDQLGDFRNVRTLLTSSPRGNFGDLHYNPKHPLIEQVLHDAEHDPHRLAMSHTAIGSGKVDGDWHLIEEAKSVASVDLVCVGATNVSLFESEHPLKDGEKCPTCGHVKGEKDEDDDMEKTNEGLKSRIEKLEGDIRLNECRKAREASVKAAGIEVSESLMEHLVTCSQSSADVIIESLRGTVSHAPLSRDPNYSHSQFKTCDEFVTALGS